MRLQEGKRRKPTHDDQVSHGAIDTAVHFAASWWPSVASSDPGLTFHILTWPSRPPLAMRWYDPRHEGAQATEVMACEVTEGVLAGSTAVEVCSGLTGAPALEADEKGVASRVRRVFDPCDTHH